MSLRSSISLCSSVSTCVGACVCLLCANQTKIYEPHMCGGCNVHYAQWINRVTVKAAWVRLTGQLIPKCLVKPPEDARSSKERERWHQCFTSSLILSALCPPLWMSGAVPLDRIRRRGTLTSCNTNCLTCAETNALLFFLFFSLLLAHSQMWDAGPLQWIPSSRWAMTQAFSDPQKSLSGDTGNSVQDRQCQGFGVCFPRWQLNSCHVWLHIHTWRVHKSIWRWCGGSLTQGICPKRWQLKTWGFIYTVKLQAD